MGLQLGDELLVDLDKNLLALRVKVQDELVTGGVPALRYAEYLVVGRLPLLNPLAAIPLVGGGSLRLLSQVLVLDHLADLVAALGRAVLLIFLLFAYPSKGTE
jgi:hypothetical protein